MALPEIVAFLDGTCPMPTELKNLIYETAKRCEVRRKTKLLVPGEICEHLYYIEKGILGCFETEGKKRYCTWLMMEGDIATSVNSFNNQVPSTETIVALEDCIVWVLTKEQLEDICARFVEFRIIRQLLTDKYHLQSRTMDAQRKRKPEHFYVYLEKNYPEMVSRVPNNILASFMGITEPTLYDIKKRRRNSKRPI
jgi:CRP/FNR family transcriptional regulator, anaerobic regulatory protein